MKNIIITACIALFSLSYTAQTKWNLSTEGIEINFAYAEEKTEGSFSDLTANINFDPSDLANSSITASVPAKSINTKNKMRDQHLRSEDFFDVESHANITFTSSSFEKTDKGFQVTGKLNLKGNEHQELIEFTFEEDTFKGAFTIDISKYGLSKKPNDVVINLVVPVSN